MKKRWGFYGHTRVKCSHTSATYTSKLHAKQVEEETM